jgi:pseudaminic acid synthase
VKRFIEIDGRRVGPGYPVYLVAEISANHHQEFDEAVRLLQAAKDAGADAVKLQTYTADTLTISSDRDYFRISGGTPWDGGSLYDLYKEAFTPWEWQPRLKAMADRLGITLFSTAFDPSAVDFLEAMDVPVHKIASFEIVDIPLIKKMARTGKPLILSTGMATLEEIEEAVQAARLSGGTELALLKCTSAYPATPEEMNLRTIPHLAETFNVPVGLSDHTLGTETAVAAVTLGACIVEKHFTLSRGCPGPDSAFSLEPQEFKTVVGSIRTVEEALGKVQYGATSRETQSLVFRRSLFVVKDVKQGEPFTQENVRSIRPGYGLAPKYLEDILGRCASMDIKQGTPLTWDHVLRS